MFTFTPDKEATDWTKAVQEGLGRGKEGVDETWGEMDISEFVERVKDSVETDERVGGLNRRVLEKTEASGEPFIVHQIEKLRMLRGGYSPEEIDDMTREWAKEYDLDEADIEDEFIGEEPKKLREIKKLSGEEQEKAIEALARENVLKQERREGTKAFREVLAINDIVAEVKEVEKIEPKKIQRDLLGKPVFTPVTVGKTKDMGIDKGEVSEKDVAIKIELSEAVAKLANKNITDPKEVAAELMGQKELFKNPSNIMPEVRTAIKEATEGFELPFETRGVPVEAAITTAEYQLGLMAMGSDTISGYHGGYHLLRVHLTAKDVRVLDKRFKGDEEAEAREFAQYAFTGNAKVGYLKGIWRKLVEKLRKIKSMLQGRGYRTVDDIFGEIQRGEIKKARAKGAGIKLETSGERMLRESIRQARIRAEKERLKARITPKARIGRLPIKIHDYTPVLSEEMGKQPGARAVPRPETFKPKTAPDATAFLRDDLEPAKLPPAKPIEELGKRVATPKLTQKWFDENVGKQPLQIMSRVSRETREIADDLARAVWSSSTRLEKIHPELMRRMREYCYRWMKRTSYMLEDAEPFLKKFKKLRSKNFEDWKALDLALKNSQAWKAEEIVAKHGMTEEYATVKGLYGEIADMWDQVGGDLKRRADYWHREIKDSKGFLKHFYNTEHWSAIEQALKNRARKAGRDVADLTDEEKAQVINTLLRRYRTQAVTPATPGAVKERLVPEVDKSIDRYYYDSGVSLVRYIREMNQAISQREFFGRETHLINKLRAQQSRRLSRLIKLKKLQGLKPGTTEPKYREHISKTAEEWKAGQERLERLRSRDLTQTIGGYVGKLKDQGLLSAEQERNVQKIISGILQPRGMGKKTGIFTTGVYLDTLNSFFQALTQLDEYAYSVIMSPGHAIPAGIRTIARKNPITLRDIGVMAPGVEFEDKSLKKALATMLTATTFRGIDVFGKESLINTAFVKYKSEARSKTLRPKFVSDMKRAFGPEYKEVIEDLKRGEITENVNYLLFNVAADRQPIAHSEMPEMYNTGGNARILYTLKTFYLKRLDFVRKECWDDMKHAKTFPRGFAKLVWIVGAFAALGAGSDALKDFLKGKTFDFADSVWNNILNFIMWSKYSQYKAKTEGYGRTAAEKLVPPTKFIDALTKDIVTIATGRDRGFEIWRSVPIVGEPYYWWFGEGKRKEQAKRHAERGATK